MPAHQIQKIVKRGKQHQYDNEGQTQPETHFLRPLTERASPQGLEQVKEQVPPIKQGNGQQIDQADGDGQDRRQVHPRAEAKCRHLASP